MVLSRVWGFKRARKSGQVEEAVRVWGFLGLLEILGMEGVWEG